MWGSILVEALRWIKDSLPQLATGFAVWVYERMRAVVRRERVEKEQAELEKKYLENENAVEADNKNKSDLDIVRDAIREGERASKRS